MRSIFRKVPTIRIRIDRWAPLALLFAPLFIAHWNSTPTHAAPPAGREWIREGIVASSDMESLTFILRRGGGSANAIREWHAQRTEAAVMKLKGAGVNFAIINFHKGAGLKAEAQDIESARQFTALAHKYGIRVAGYVGATMMYETLFLEEPDAPNWRQVDEFGHPIYYTQDQTFRYMACRNNPGYQAFIRKVVRAGIEDVKLDAIHFDQMQWWPEPRSCRCQYCRAQFREFLAERYSDPQRAYPRFGFANFTGVIPPPFDLQQPPVHLAELTNPMMQEWAHFRAASLAKRFSEFAQYIHKLNPAAAMIGNPTMNLESNVGFMYGVDPERLFPTADGIWTEEPNLPQWTADDRLVSQIRSYKAARAMGRPLFHWQDLTGYAEYQHAPAELRLAESLAYDDANLGVVAGGDAGGNQPPPVFRDYIRFFHSHLQDLVHTREIADVAILRSFPSTQFNPSRSNVSTVLFEQALIQSKIPFGIVFDRQLRDLSRYKALVLADEDALSDEQLGYIRKFVENGGGLVATGNSSMLTQWRTKRSRFGLADLFGIDRPPENPASDQIVERRFGNGRVAYIARIEAVEAPPAPSMNYYVRNTLWKLPRNYAALIDAVRYAAGGEFSATVDAPLWVTAQLCEQDGSRTRLLHLLNFKVAEPVVNIKVRVRVPAGLRVREALLFGPRKSDPLPIEASTRAGVASLTVPRLNVYGMVLLRMENER
jgi:hypothetical protein